MFKVLITGSNGLLGQKLVERFRSEGGHEIIATSFSENIAFNKDGYRFELMDITNPAEVEYILNRYEPEVILHTAGLTQVTHCEKNQEEAWRTNVEATETLAKASNKHGSHFILLSSDFVFDGRKGPYKETDATGPVNYYGQTKLEAEKIAGKISKSLSIVRTCLVYGTNFKMNRSNFLLWVKHCLGESERIKINNDQWRTPTLAEDLAEACAIIANTKAKGIYHISGAENVRLLDYAYTIADFYKLDKEFITEVTSSELAETGLRPLKSGLLIDKAVSELGFSPHNIIEGLEIITKQLKSMESTDD
jgi:dTDP-4-dehydrorhamnose reductase